MAESGAVVEQVAIDGSGAAAEVKEAEGEAGKSRSPVD